MKNAKRKRERRKEKEKKNKGENKSPKEKWPIGALLFAPFLYSMSGLPLDHELPS